MTTTQTTEANKVEVMSMDVNLTASHRCDRCEAQAYYEFEVGFIKELEPGKTYNVKTALLLCAHHANKHHDAVVAYPLVTRVFDHRPALKSMGKPAQ